VWETATGRLHVDYLGHQAGVQSVAVTPDGWYVVSGDWDGTVKVWETATGRLHVDYLGHQAGVQSVAVTPDGRYVVSESADRTVQVWETATGECVNTLFFEGDVRRVSLVEGPPMQLVVVDASGQWFIYEVVR